MKPVHLPEAEPASHALKAKADRASVQCSADGYQEQASVGLLETTGVQDGCEVQRAEDQGEMGDGQTGGAHHPEGVLKVESKVKRD